MRVAPGHRANRMKEEVGAVDDLGDRSQDALPVDEETRETIRMFVERAENRVRVLEQKAEERREDLQKGDELPPGVIKMVKVFVAIKRKPRSASRLTGNTIERLSLLVTETNVPHRDNVSYFGDGTDEAQVEAKLRELKDAEREYPAHWIEDAVRAALSRVLRPIRSQGCPAGRSPSCLPMSRAARARG